ncbi:hypothetical protein IIA94_02920, partial [Patescibacteria group bacterium]|nr:hypothetical protein [Patescibacteria group bacterium]
MSRVIIVLFIVLLACGENGEIISVSTATPSPSPTSIPTVTPSPSPIVVEKVYLEGPTVTFVFEPDGALRIIKVEPEVYKIIGRRLIMEVKNRQVTYISVLTIVDPNKKFYTLSSKESFLVTGELII